VSNETADLIVVASAVHAMASGTAAADAGPVTALAVRGGQIAATAGPDGARDLLAAWRGPGTVVLDDPGLVVLPAFVDTHNHLMLAAQNILGVPVSRAADIPGLVRLIRERAAQTPPGQWIRTAADWHELRLAERRLPTAAELDEATTDHPVLLQRGGHNGVLNSAGLRLAGIGRDTPDLEGGFIDRDAAGDPRGWVQHGGLIAGRVAQAVSLGVHVTVQQALLDGLAPAFLAAWGADRTAALFPWRELVDAGAWISAGTDHPIGPLRPLRAVGGMTTRATPAGVLGPEHAITRDEALRLYTVGGARFLGGAAAGALVPGAPADLVAFPADPFTCPDEQLPGLSPAVTVIGGQIAYQAG
jgi:predicted amidohydrolase YtcJ